MQFIPSLILLPGEQVSVQGMFFVSSIWVFPPLQKTKPAEEMHFSSAAEMQRLKKVLCSCESIIKFMSQCKYKWPKILSLNVACLFNWESLDYLTRCISETQTYRDNHGRHNSSKTMRKQYFLCVHVCKQSNKKKDIWMLLFMEPVKERCHRNETRATGRPWKLAETLLIAFNRWINLVHQ